LTATEWIAVSVPIAVLLLGVILAGLGWALRRLIREVDSAHRERIDGIRDSVTELRHMSSALSDTIYAGFELAAKERSDIAQRLARMEGHLGFVTANGGRRVGD
jgi:hypothetical protein